MTRKKWGNSEPAIPEYPWTIWLNCYKSFLVMQMTTRRKRGEHETRPNIHNDIRQRQAPLIFEPPLHPGDYTG